MKTVVGYVDELRTEKSRNSISSSAESLASEFGLSYAQKIARAAIGDERNRCAIIAKRNGCETCFSEIVSGVLA